MREVSSKLGYREKIFFGIGEIAATSSNTIIGFLYLYYLIVSEFQKNSDTIRYSF
jgi:hypothetical protein